MKLTALNVAKLRPRGGKRTDYRDVFLPGLVLRVSPAGRSWVVEYWVPGQRAGCRATIGHYPLMSLAEARDRATQVLTAVDRGEPTSAEPPPRRRPLTVAAMVEQCLGDLELRPSTRQEWGRLLRIEIKKAPLGALVAADVKRHDVRAWTKAIRERSGWTAKHAFELLRRGYSWAVREELLEASPCDRMALPYEGHSSDRVLSAEELDALLRALERTRRIPSRLAYADATRLLLLTGVRRAAVLGMRRGELEGLEGPDPRWVIPGGHLGRSKSGRPHVVPLVPAALEVVARRLELVDGEHLFPAGRGVEEDRPMTWSWWWRAWLIRRVQRTQDARRRMAGLEGEAPVPRWTIHNLRHAMATHLREDLAVAPDVVALLLGHTLPGPRITRVYDRAERLGERRAALTAWAAWLGSLRARRAARARVLPISGRAGVVQGVQRGRSVVTRRGAPR